MRQRQEFGTKSHSAPTDVTSVCLFEEYVVLDKANKDFWIGQVLRITNKGQEYVRPVAIDDPQNSTIQLYIVKYNREANVLTPGDQIPKVPLRDILCQIALTSDGGDRLYVDSSDMDHIKNQVAALLCPHPKRRKHKESTRVSKKKVPDDPSLYTPSQDGVRRSKRQRTIIIHECE